MYTRGQLALIGNVGRKAIRLYEENGLIKAAKIDAANGYHYYDEEQIERLKKIKKYKQLGMSLAEIREILCCGVSEDEILFEKKQELDSTIKDMQELRKKMDTINHKESIEEKAFIQKCCFGECSCIYVKENVELEKLGASVGKLYEQASKNQLTVCGAHFVKYEGLFAEDTAFQMTTCLPIEKTDKKIENITIESANHCIHMNFTGGFSKVGNAHIQMKEYMDANSISGTGTVYEVYNQDMSVDIYYELKNEN